jgi:hypothetical protein
VFDKLTPIIIEVVLAGAEYVVTGVVPTFAINEFVKVFGITFPYATSSSKAATMQLTVLVLDIA